MGSSAVNAPFSLSVAQSILLASIAGSSPPCRKSPLPVTFCLCGLFTLQRQPLWLFSLLLCRRKFDLVVLEYISALATGSLARSPVVPTDA